MAIIESLIVGILGSLMAAFIGFFLKAWWDSKDQPSLPPFTTLNLSDGHTLSSTQAADAALLSETNSFFSGRVEALTDDMLSHPASIRRIQQFYAGAKLDWDIITAHGDIPRDQHEEFLKQASQPFNELRLLCIVAEAGAGKSTSAWRIAAELHQQHKAFVIHVKDSDDPDVWYRLPEFCTKVGKPFYVLVDDIFHDSDATIAFQQLKPWLPITVLASSRQNEYRAHRLKYEISRLDLHPPSSTEKERILNKLGLARSDLTIEQQHRLDAANQFLVLMIELTEGKELADIVRDTIETLYKLDESAYSAYEYLCFAYQYSIAFPISLLERLDKQSRFHKLPERETTQGLIFWDDREGHIRVGHPIIAKTSAEFFAQGHSAQALLAEIAEAVNTSDINERRFIASLLRILARLQSPLLISMPEHLEIAISNSFHMAQSIRELMIWRAFYQYRNQNERAEDCVDLALALAPQSSQECNLLLNLCRERGREQDALSVIKEWITDHPQEGGAYPAYLTLIERYGDPDEIKTTITETRAWLSSHPDEVNVYERYLGLIERKGTPEQLAQAVQDTKIWLAEHPQDVNVRTVYLGLVGREGTPEQLAQAVQDTKIWLAEHPQDVNVRTVYLGLVEHKGTSEEINQIVEEIGVWLVDHPADHHVRERYLGLIERKGTPEHFAHWAEQTRRWLLEHPKDVNVRQAWLSLVETRAEDSFKEIVISETKLWLIQYPFAKEVWTSLLGWLFRASRTQEAVDLALLAISHHPNHQNSLEHLLRAVQESADEQTIRSVYEQLINSFPKDLFQIAHYAAWSRDHGYHEEAEQRYKALLDRAPGLYKARYGYGVLLLQRKRLHEAVAQFRELIRIHKGHSMAHNKLAWALWELGELEQAEKEFRRAIYWAELNKKPLANLHNDLGWFYLNRSRWHDAMRSFELARDENPEYFRPYWGIGKTFYEMGEYGAAADALRIALEKEPNLEQPARDEISQLLKQCLDQLTVSPKNL